MNSFPCPNHTCAQKSEHTQKKGKNSVSIINLWFCYCILISHQLINNVVKITSGNRCCFSRGLCLTGSSRDPVIVCSPCHVAEEFSGLITLLFPDNQTADTWSFEVLGSRDTAGRYTCHGGQWLETFQSLPCSIPFTLEDTASNAASINITKGEFSSLDVQIQTHTCRLTSIRADLTSVRKVNDYSF